MPEIFLGIPAQIVDLFQKGLLERAFHDGLYPQLGYRSEALFEEWPANSGTEVFMSRAGLLKPIVKASVPGVDPLPQAVNYEQWGATLGRYNGTIDVHMPSSAVANASLFMRDIQQLGLQAGQSVNRIARDAMFQAYLSGHTVLTAAAGAGDVTINVASLNGFLDVVVPGSNVRPKAISSASPLQLTIGTGAAKVTRNAIGFSPNNPDDPTGPGVLLLSAAVGGGGFATRSPVLSAYRPRVIRSGGGDSVDAIGASDTFELQNAINAAALLRKANVQPHEDGFYHAQISPLANAQVFSDPAFQRLNTSLPEHAIYKEGFIGVMSGVMFYMNNESPDQTTSGDLVSTSTNAMYASEVGSEVVNDGGTEIGRILVTGKGVMYERGLNEDAFVSEAGIQGRIGEFDIVNNGMNVLTDRIKLILRAPVNRTQDIVAATWSITTSFPVPSDVTATSGPERFKRAIVIEHAL